MNSNNSEYIEDYLHYLVGEIGVDFSDEKILHSINKQVNTKGLALTDRQYDFVYNKILNYKTKIEEFGKTLPQEKLKTRTPLRTIDRSKYIKVVNIDNVKWIEIRFPFNKKTILDIEKIKPRGNYIDQYKHEKSSHIHHIKFTAYNVKEILDIFTNKCFEIQKELIEYYYNLDDIIKEYDKFYSIQKNTLLQEYNNDKVKFMDDKFYNGHNFNLNLSGNTLTDKIASRDTSIFLAQKSIYKFNEVVEALVKLNRFPLCVLIDTGSPALAKLKMDEDTVYSQLTQIYDSFKYIFSDEEQSVLFRVDNKKNKQSVVNSFIKNNNLNNWVDKKTKIVYIMKNKLPKLFLKTDDFIPRTALSLSSIGNQNHVELYVRNRCDLILYYDEELSLISRSIW